MTNKWRPLSISFPDGNRDTAPAMRRASLIVSGVVAFAVTVESVAASAATLPDPGTWSACPDMGPPVECGLLEVPLDYAGSRSEVVRLPIRRVRATNEAERVGVLVTIAGGPGQRGTDGVRPGAHTPAIHERFDIVSWDPRGTSGETLIDCIPNWDPYPGLDRTPDTVAERDILDRSVATLADGCIERHGDILPFVGTVEAARDLERLRQLLGEETISVLGMSYGSRVAVTYATLYPDRIRAIVLDGYSDPNLPPGELEIEQAAAFERELDAVLGACAGDPTCPFHSDGRPDAALDRLLADLDDTPLGLDGAVGLLTQSDAHEAIAGTLLWGAAARSRLLEAIASAATGDGKHLRGMADGVRQAFESSGLTMGAFMAISCADAAQYWDALSLEQLDDLTQRVYTAAPRLGPWLWSPPHDASLPPVGLCAMQQARASRPRGRLDAAGAGEVLVLATTGDPTTPASGARRAAQSLEHATVVTLDADHHLAYSFAVADPTRAEHRCVLDAVEGYLQNLRSPTAGMVCDA